MRSADDWRFKAGAMLHNDGLRIGVGRALSSPSLRTGQADLPHPALQSVVHLRGLTVITFPSMEVRQRINPCLAKKAFGQR